LTAFIFSIFLGRPQRGFNKEEYNNGNLLDISTFSPIFRENPTKKNTIIAILLNVSTFFGHPQGGFNKEEYNKGNLLDISTFSPILRENSTNKIQ